MRRTWPLRFEPYLEFGEERHGALLPGGQINRFVALKHQLEDHSPVEVRRMKPENLYDHYVMFGDDPFIVVSGGGKEPGDGFSAWDYAQERCQSLCAEANERGAQNKDVTGRNL